VHTVDIARLHSESPPQKRSGMARVLKGSHNFTCTPTHSSAIGMSHTCLCLSSYSWCTHSPTAGRNGRLSWWDASTPKKFIGGAVPRVRSSLRPWLKQHRTAIRCTDADGRGDRDARCNHRGWPAAAAAARRSVRSITGG